MEEDTARELAALRAQGTAVRLVLNQLVCEWAIEQQDPTRAVEVTFERIEEMIDNHPAQGGQTTIDDYELTEAVRTSVASLRGACLARVARQVGAQ